MALSSYNNEQSVFLIVHAWIFLIIAFICNAIAVVFVYLHSHQNIGTYRYILYTLLIFNIFFSLINSIADVEPHMSPRSLVLIGAVNIADETTSIILIYLAIFTFVEAILFVTGQIVHRCLLIYGFINAEKTLKGAFFIAFLSFFVLFLWIAWFLNTGVTTLMCVNKFDNYTNFTIIDTNPICDDFMTQLQYLYNFNTASFVSIPFQIQNPATNAYEVNANAVILFAFLLFMLIVSITLIIVCSLLIFRKIKSSKAQRNEIQMELFKTLIGQALCPILFLQAPLLVASIITVIDNNLNWVYLILYFTLAWFPAIQPLVLIFGVGSYRRKALRYLDLLVHHKNEVIKPFYAGMGRIKKSSKKSVKFNEETVSTNLAH